MQDMRTWLEVLHAEKGKGLIRTRSRPTRSQQHLEAALLGGLYEEQLHGVRHPQRQYDLVGMQVVDPLYRFLLWLTREKESEVIAWHACSSDWQSPPQAGYQLSTWTLLPINLAGKLSEME